MTRGGAPPPDLGVGRAGLRLEPMARRHLRAVLRIERQVHSRPWSRGLYLGELERADTRAYRVARIGRRVVGYGGLMFVVDEAHVTTLAVDPPWQGRRIGGHLMLDLAREAVARGSRSLTLEVRSSNRYARALYARFGFAPAGVRRNYYAEVGEDAIIMWAHDVDGPAYADRLDAIADDLGVPTGVPSGTGGTGVRR